MLPQKKPKPQPKPVSEEISETGSEPIRPGVKPPRISATQPPNPLPPRVPSSNLVQESFEQKYHKGGWNRGLGRGSGSGSTLNYTVEIRRILTEFVKEHDITAMLDAPCGGFLWMPYALDVIEETTPNFRYYGWDVVRSLIEMVKEENKEIPNWSFEVVDFSEERGVTFPDVELIFFS